MTQSVEFNPNIGLLIRIIGDSNIEKVEYLSTSIINTLIMTLWSLIERASIIIFRTLSHSLPMSALSFPRQGTESPEVSAVSVNRPGRSLMRIPIYLQHSRMSSRSLLVRLLELLSYLWVPLRIILEVVVDYPSPFLILNASLHNIPEMSGSIQIKPYDNIVRGEEIFPTKK